MQYTQCIRKDRNRNCREIQQSVVLLVYDTLRNSKICWRSSTLSRVRKAYICRASNDVETARVSLRETRAKHVVRLSLWKWLATFAIRLSDAMLRPEKCICPTYYIEDKQPQTEQRTAHPKMIVYVNQNDFIAYVATVMRLTLEIQMAHAASSWRTDW